MLSMARHGDADLGLLILKPAKDVRGLVCGYTAGYSEQYPFSR